VPRYVCESCGRVDNISEEEAFKIGWDYPPFMGQWGVVMPRTCPNCLINTTVWWKLAVEKKRYEDLSDKDKAFVESIMLETMPGGPASSS
jgi:hypothetical protein